jgi:hypothetical protein
MYPKMYLGLVWDTCKIHAKYQDTCILLECNRAFKIHLRYIRIHEGYMYPSGYTQDTSRYIRIRILITNPPKLDNKPPRSPTWAEVACVRFEVSTPPAAPAASLRGRAHLALGRNRRGARIMARMVCPLRAGLPRRSAPVYVVPRKPTRVGCE